MLWSKQNVLGILGDQSGGQEEVGQNKYKKKINVILLSFHSHHFHLFYFFMTQLTSWVSEDGK